MSDQTKKPVYINRENFTDKIKSYLRPVSYTHLTLPTTTLV